MLCYVVFVPLAVYVCFGAGRGKRGDGGDGPALPSAQQHLCNTSAAWLVPGGILVRDANAGNAGKARKRQVRASLAIALMADRGRCDRGGRNSGQSEVVDGPWDAGRGLMIDDDAKNS